MNELSESDRKWCDVIINLLWHFECSEGTTHLWHDWQRNEFLEGLDPDLRERVAWVLTGFHDQLRLK